ncbi:hypothetical protein BDV19DRAFT_33350 [Aspergillus venezuelensis]
MASLHPLPEGTPPSKGPPKESGNPLPRRQKIQMACNSCRMLRTKCDGLRPSCSPCIARDRTCDYADFDGRTRASFIAHIRELEEKIQEQNDTIKYLQHQSSPEQLENPQGDQGATASALRDAKGKGPMRAIQPPSAAEPPGVSSLDEHDSGHGLIPSEQTTRRATSAFFSCVGRLIHIKSQDSTEYLINHVYHYPATDAQSVCELCAIAAVGCEYDGDQVSISSKKVYFQRAILLLCDALEDDIIKTLAVLICLATILILTNRRSARALLECGLSLSRRYLSLDRPSAVPYHGNLELLRLFQTLISIDCWLGVNLDYTPSLMIHELQILEQLNPRGAENNNTNPTTPLLLIQFQFNKATTLSAHVLTSLRNTQTLHPQDIEQGSDTLDTWRQQLPTNLRMQALLDENKSLEPLHRRCLLLLHAVHLEGHILLFSKYICQSRPDKGWNLPPIFAKHTPACLSSLLIWFL